MAPRQTALQNNWTAFPRLRGPKQCTRIPTARSILPPLVLLALAALTPCHAASPTHDIHYGSGAASSPLAGTWRFDSTRSTELSPWQDYTLTLTLTLTVTGDRVAIQQQLGAGRRGFADTMSLDTSQPDNVVPVTLWADNRHIGAYIGGDKTKHVRAEWLDGGRILRLSTDLVLSTSQGDRPVNILSDYKVSANGAVLTLTELRSTRNRPVVYVFNRAPAASK